MKYSFHRIGTHNGNPVIYTEPVLGDLIKTDAEFAGFCRLMDRYVNRKWYWFINCRDMGWEHISSMYFAKQMYDHITQKHNDSIIAGWVFNCNIFCRMLFPLFPEPRLRVMPVDRLELLVTLQQESVAPALIDHCLNRLKL